LWQSADSRLRSPGKIKTLLGCDVRCCHTSAECTTLCHKTLLTFSQEHPLCMFGGSLDSSLFSFPTCKSCTLEAKMPCAPRHLATWGQKWKGFYSIAPSTAVASKHSLLVFKYVAVLPQCAQEPRLVLEAACATPTPPAPAPSWGRALPATAWATCSWTA